MRVLVFVQRVTAIKLLNPMEWVRLPDQRENQVHSDLSAEQTQSRA